MTRGGRHAGLLTGEVEGIARKLQADTPVDAPSFVLLRENGRECQEGPWASPTGNIVREKQTSVSPPLQPCVEIANCNLQGNPTLVASSRLSCHSATAQFPLKSDCESILRMTLHGAPGFPVAERQGLPYASCLRNRLKLSARMTTPHATSPHTCGSRSERSAPRSTTPRRISTKYVTGIVNDAR